MSREIVPGVVEVLFARALVHAYIVWADVPTLIDTGTPGAAKTLITALEASDLRPEDIGRIVLTHAHSDHAGNAAQLAQRSGAEVHVSPGTAPFVREGREQPRPQVATPLGKLMVPYVKAALPWRVEPVEVQETLVEGAMIGPFRVLETPGHQAGHVSLLWEERSVLFTGDAAANITALGPHPAADDPHRQSESFERLGREAFETACFGHGRALSAGAAGRFRATATATAPAPAPAAA